MAGEEEGEEGWKEKVRALQRVGGVKEGGKG